jgi:chromatin remodeling complex protein RSC6
MLDLLILDGFLNLPDINNTVCVFMTSYDLIKVLHDYINKHNLQQGQNIHINESLSKILHTSVVSITYTELNKIINNIIGK